jgi:poly-gamma-glutamate synthesis protein (capsule biosynthesis protein)
MSDASGSGATLVAVGDLHIDRVPPEEIFERVREDLRSGDLTFANSEQTYAIGTWPDPHHATFSHPRNVDAIVDAGIDVLSLANNPTMDWGPDVLLESIERLETAGVSVVGAGAQRDAARRPVVMTRNGVRIGFLAYNCVGPDSYVATEAEPGNAGIRVWTIYEQVDYQPGTPPRVVTLADRAELDGMREAIATLKEECDTAVVSFHWGQHVVPRVIPDYCSEIGRAAVDAGADLVLGGHPHLLKGVEFYRGRAIFYSLGNFAWEQGNGPEKFRILFRKRHTNLKLYSYTPTPWPTNMHPEGHATMIVKASISPAGRVDSISFKPCYIDSTGQPECFARGSARGDEVFDYMRSVSESEGLSVHFEWSEDGSEVVLFDPVATAAPESARSEIS